MRQLNNETTTIQGGNAPGFANLRALNACKIRIRALQTPAAAGHSGDTGRRQVRLQEEVDSAVRIARACTREGEWRQVLPARLAGMVHSFAKMRQFPVARSIDSIVACMGQEVGRRATEGSLAHWSPTDLALVTHGLGKSQAAGARQGLTCVAQAFVTISPLTHERGWTASLLCMMANGLRKGEGASIDQALTHLAQALLTQRPLTVEAGWNAPALATMANALAWGQGPQIQNALTHLGRSFAISRLLTPAAGGQPLDLSIVPKIMARREGVGFQVGLVRRLAQHLAQAEQQRRQGGWTADALRVMTNALARGARGEASRRHWSFEHRGCRKNGC